MLHINTLFKMFLQALFVTILLSGLSSGASLNGSQRIKRIDTDWQNISEKCLKNGHTEAFLDLINSYHDSQICFSNWFKVVAEADVDGKVNIICTENQHNINDCISEFLDDMEVCLFPEERYFPTFLQNWLDKIVKHMCLNQGASLKESLRGIGQVGQTANHNSIFTILGCAHQVFPGDLFLQMGEVVTKEKFCGYVQQVQTCCTKELSGNLLVPQAVADVSIKIVDLAYTTCASL